MKGLPKKATKLFFLRYFGYALIPIMFMPLITSLILPAAFSDFLYSALPGVVYFVVVVLLPYIVIGPIIYWLSNAIRKSHRYEIREDGLYREYGVIYTRKILFPYEKISEIYVSPRLFGLYAVIVLGNTAHSQVRGVSHSPGPAAGQHPSFYRRMPGLLKEDADAIKNEVEKRARSANSVPDQKDKEISFFKKHLLAIVLVTVLLALSLLVALF